MAYNDLITANNPLFYWTMDDTNGSNEPNLGSDSSGTLVLSSTNTGTGIPAKSPATSLATGSSPAIYGQCNSLTDFTVNKAFTVEYWVKTAAKAEDSYIWTRNGGTRNVKQWINSSSGTNPGMLQTQIVYSGGTRNFTALLKRIDDNAWHHIIWQQTSTDNRIWIDGVEGTFSGTSGTPGSTASITSPIIIGRNTTSNVTTLNGLVDEFAIYNNVALGNTLSTHYASGIAGGSTDVNYSATPATGSATAPNATFKADKSLYLASPMTGQGTAPSTVSVTTTNNASFTASALTGSGTMTPDGRVSKIYTSTVFSSLKEANISTVTPVTGLTPAKMWTNADAQLFFATPTVPSNGQLGKATLNLIMYYFSNATSVTVTVAPYTVANPTYSSPVDSASAVSFTVLAANKNASSEVLASVDAAKLVNYWNAGNANNGLRLQSTSTTDFFGTQGRTNASGAVHPTLETWYSGDAQASLTINGDPMLGSAIAPPATATGVKSPTFFATPMTGSGLAPNAVASISKDAAYTASAITASGLAPNATAALQQNVTIVSDALLGTGLTPNAVVFSPSVTVRPNGPATGVGNAIDAVVTVVADRNFNATVVTGSATIGNITVSNQTDRVVTTNVMTASGRLPEVYKTNSRYYNSLRSRLGTTSTQTWYQFRNGVSNVGSYRGTPAFGILGYKDELGVRFSGDDYIALPDFVTTTWSNQLSISGGNAWSVEMTIKTTARSGALFGGGYAYISSGSPDMTKQPRIRLEIVGDNLRLVSQQDFPRNGGAAPVVATYDIFGTVNDGQWHHVYVQFADGVNNANEDSYGPAGKRVFVMIDGQIVWSRQFFEMNCKPEFIGASIQDGTRNTPTNFLTADFGDIVVVGGPASQTTPGAMTGVYYEWSDTLLIASGAAATGSGRAVDATTKGNSKKMLLLYGNYYALGSTPNSVGAKVGVGYDPFAGIHIPEFPFSESASTFANSYEYTARVFDILGYKAYPVNYLHNRDDADGMVKTYYDENGAVSTGFVDDVTGLTRYINLQKDLLVDVADFDCIYVMNWPDANQDTIGTPPLGQFASLTESQYDLARQAFVDSIRAAVDKGVSLWIANPNQAVDFGIIQGYSVHDDLGTNSRLHAEARDRELFGLISGNTDPIDGVVPRNPLGTGNWVYNDTYKIKTRRITSTATGFSEGVTSYYGESISWYDTQDPWGKHATGQAANLVVNQDGLIIGTQDEIGLYGETVGVNGIVGSRRIALGLIKSNNSEFATTEEIVSAVPQGIVGQVVSREALQVWQGNTLVDNPYKDNALTILLDKGTVLNGKPLGGRIFVEFMSTGEYGATRGRVKPEFRNILNGRDSSAERATHWDIDTRRDTYVLSAVPGSDTLQTVITTGLDNNSFDFFTTKSMRQRGLEWLGLRPWIGAGGVTEYKPTAMTADGEFKAPQYKAIRNTIVTAQGMIGRGQIIKPTSIPDPNATFAAFALTGAGDIGKWQRVFTATPMVGTGTIVDTAIKGEGTTLTVYFSFPELTLYLEEL